jgi:hypothetical protein
MHTAVKIIALSSITSFANAAVIHLPDYSLTPDGTNSSTTFQDTNVSTLNGGAVLPTTAANVVYFVSTFTFGTGSNAHFEAGFRHSNLAARLGVAVNDDGLVQIIGTGTPLPSVNLAKDMAGQTITLLAKLHYDSTHSVTYLQSNVANDTVMNVWINPTEASVEGSGLSAGDMSTIWNSAAFTFFRQTIQNQSTPDTAGVSSITNTVILTGSEATFANALAIAIPEPSTALLSGLGFLALLRRRRA